MSEGGRENKGDNNTSWALVSNVELFLGHLIEKVGSNGTCLGVHLLIWQYLHLCVVPTCVEANERSYFDLCAFTSAQMTVTPVRVLVYIRPYR